MPSDTTVDVSLDSIPVPALRYGVRNGDPVVTHVNESFEAAFGDAPTGVAVREWLNASAVVCVERSAAAVCASLAGGERVATTVRDSSGTPLATYRLQSVADSAASTADHGVLTLTEAEQAAGATEVDRVASVVTHDLRNPLDVAEARLQAAREEGGDEHFEKVERAHERMERIISDVLTLTRGEEVVTPSETVDLAEVAAAAWASVNTEAATLTLGENLPTVEADPARLQRLFENLYRNSVEHARETTSSESGAVRIRVERTRDGGFFVADDGRGVPESERDVVFEPGYSGGGDGPGLGLAIVDRIAAAHGWSVTVASAEDGGARFEFRETPRSATR